MPCYRAMISWDFLMALYHLHHKRLTKKGNQFETRSLLSGIDKKKLVLHAILASLSKPIVDL
ncbi:hypothetical protein Pint_20979 [Pistacia integerrima]|uniref:Uncharacterized protein n=1 Tax=Pistacia integerrima TaxID=434235 RepID=A0ACC0XAT8_9ROSI|nr:hypothetical protein Pint_20979 [Pistacia integerrima]